MAILVTSPIKYTNCFNSAPLSISIILAMAAKQRVRNVVKVGAVKYWDWEKKNWAASRKMSVRSSGLWPVLARTGLGAAWQPKANTIQSCASHASDSWLLLIQSVFSSSANSRR